MRVYVPANLALLAESAEAGVIPGSNEYFIAEDESEDAEYEALWYAANDAADLLHGVGRRVVIVAEAVAGEDGVAAVPMEKVLAVHADTEDVDPLADNLPDLGWFAVQEIPDLLG
jgi:hypothetical protein